MKNTYKNTYCEYCGNEYNGYQLCYDCYLEAKEENIIKSSNGTWIRNVMKGNENRYFQENKNYIKKQSIMTKIEKDFFKKANKVLNKKYIIYPQLNLQSIIDTDTYTRNDELFRIIDFVVVEKDSETPLFMIEINGNEHYVSDERIARDDSVKAIARVAQIPLLTLTNEQSKLMSKKEIKQVLKIIINYIKTHNSVIEPLFYTDITLNNINQIK